MKEGGSDDDRMLKFYLRTEANRENYAWEIEELILGNERLRRVYHQEMGKIHSRKIGKRLRALDIAPGWFGIYGGLIIASGKTKAEATRSAAALVPAEMRDCVYYYQLKRAE